MLLAVVFAAVVGYGWSVGWVGLWVRLVCGLGWYEKRERESKRRERGERREREESEKRE